MEETAHAHNLVKVESVIIHAGALRQIHKAALLAAWQEITQSTIAENSTLELTVLPARIRCLNCRKESGVEDICFVCGFCSSGEVEVIQGNELILHTIRGENSHGD